ncbi:MAG: hypothetical protein ACRDTC_03405 [Pseudonocardiaceae bacterium]
MVVALPEIVCSPVIDITEHNDAETATRPTLVEYQGLFYLFYRGKDTTRIFYCTSPEGTTWPKGYSLTNRSKARTRDEPSAVVHDSKLFILHLLILSSSRQALPRSSCGCGSWHTEAPLPG